MKTIWKMCIRDRYRTVNNLMGWLTFIIAATVYCLTREPTASFWDCPEFITTGYKLEVGHPPGAPEDTCIYRGPFQPIGDRNHLLVVEAQIMFVIKRVDSLY